jgi:hypothetical protein
MPPSPIDIERIQKDAEELIQKMIQERPEEYKNLVKSLEKFIIKGK